MIKVACDDCGKLIINTDNNEIKMLDLSYKIKCTNCHIYYDLCFNCHSAPDKYKYKYKCNCVERTDPFGQLFKNEADKLNDSLKNFKYTINVYYDESNKIIIDLYEDQTKLWSKSDFRSIASCLSYDSQIKPELSTPEETTSPKEIPYLPENWL